MAYRDVVPAGSDITVHLDDIWQQSGLSPAERALITQSKLVRLSRENALPSLVNRALVRGISREDVIDMVVQLASHSGSSARRKAVAIVQNAFVQAAVPPAQRRAADHI
jgi:alkylhydroperoxidase/carboxymuconolactone decarboxylase family protein YurZ